MGKIRIRTLGDEQKEKEQQKKAQQRSEAKRAQKDVEVNTEPVETTQEKKEVKKKVVKKKRAQARSKTYLTVASLVERTKQYDLKEALEVLTRLKRAKFDETVELHINTNEQGISGSVVLPHGTGKTVRVMIANQAQDPKAVEELVANVEKGQIDFDILVATPDSMPKLAKVARVLGPRGLMPNPKNGTVTPKPDEVAKKFAGGQMYFKTEAKSPIIHMAVGKLSFGDNKLEDNIKSAIAAITSKKIKNVTLKSTMSPGIKLDVASL